MKVAGWRRASRAAPPGLGRAAPSRPPPAPWKPAVHGRGRTAGRVAGGSLWPHPSPPHLIPPQVWHGQPV